MMSWPFDVSLQQLNDLLTDEGGDFLRPRRRVDEVQPRIYVGDAVVATDLRRLRRLRVTHVLNAAEGTSLMHVDTGARFYAAAGIRYLGIRASDTEHFDLSVYFEEAAQFISAALEHKHNTGKVLVHCREGYSRAPALVVSFLMLRRRLDVFGAVAAVRRQREIGPNDGFLRQLCELNRRLEAQGHFWNR